MSFPSADTRRKEGFSAKESLLYAMEHDTDLGFTAILSTANAVFEGSQDPLGHVRNAVPSARDSVLRAERRKSGLMVDFDPLSKIGMQVSRLMGTDRARELMQEEAGMALGFANCCKILVGFEQEDVEYSIDEQIDWQESIDC